MRWRKNSRPRGHDSSIHRCAGITIDEFVELSVSHTASNMLELSDVDHRLRPDEVVLLQMGQHVVRQVVGKRDDDILAPAQMEERWKEVQAAMLEKLPGMPPP